MNEIMKEATPYAAFLFPAILGGIILLIFAFRKKRGFSEKNRKKFYAKIQEFAKKTPSERIVAYDKILDHMLESLGYHGTLGEKLQSKPAILNGVLEEIWRLHKIRNRIVHDLEKPSGDILKDAVVYESVLSRLLVSGR